MDPLTVQDLGPLSNIVKGIFNDWAPYLPLTIVSAILLILFPFFAKNRKNAFILLGLLALPVIGLYSYCKFLNLNQFITSRYFISFLPLFLISIFLSLNAIESKNVKLRERFRLNPLFIVLFLASNLVVLPLYYRSEKQDFRGLVNYLDGQLKDGDKVLVKSFTYIPGIFHYFGVYPTNRHYEIPISRKLPENEFELKVSLISKNRVFTIHYSNIPYSNYIADGNRLWILAGKDAARQIKKTLPCVLKGYFDGSFSNFRRFPSDASMYLFLWDPRSPRGKPIDMLFE